MCAKRPTQKPRRGTYVIKKQKKLTRNSMLLITILFLSVVISIVVTIIALP